MLEGYRSMNELLSSSITFLQDVRQPGVFKSIQLREALGSVRDGKYKDLISGARTALMLGNDDEYARIKKTLPSFCYHGVFKGRVANDNFIASSSLFHIDVDKLDHVKLTETLATLKADPHTVFAYVSPSEEGIKAAFRVDAGKIKSDEDFKKAFTAIESYLAVKGITIDPACKDIRRISFVSYDPNLFYNKNPQVFELNTQIASVTSEFEALPDLSEDYSEITVGGDVQYTTLTPEEDSQACLERLEQILAKALPGDRHSARLRVGMLAGGFIASGRLDEAEAMATLRRASDAICDGEETNGIEWNTIVGSVVNGKKKAAPCSMQRPGRTNYRYPRCRRYRSSAQAYYRVQ